MKKGQLQVGESIMVIIILVILGIIVLVFYVGFAQQEYAIKFEEFEELNALETAQVVSSLYELRCAKPGITDLCFDLHKVEAVTATSDEYFFYYQDLFKDSKVTLTTIYPEEVEYLIYENAAADSQTIKRIDIPVPLHNSITDELTFGVLTIERYFRTNA